MDHENDSDGNKVELEASENEIPSSSPSLFGESMLKGLLIGSSAVVVLVLVFWMGLLIGERKAQYSYKWGEQYARHFGGPIIGGEEGAYRFLPSTKKQGFVGGHGTAGEVLSIENERLVVGGPENFEIVVLMSSKTKVVMGRQRVSPEKIHEGSYVVVIGAPNKYVEIEALLIRLFESPPRRVISGDTLRHDSNHLRMPGLKGSL